MTDTEPTPATPPGWQARAASYADAGMAEAYARYRPGYPDEAVRWLVGDSTATILELGCGTGPLTRAMTALGHRVVATDPARQMLTRLKAAKSGAWLAQAAAEDVPITAASVDLVVAGQSFHWFDADRALLEIARVLRPGGALGLIWNHPDLTVPWVRRLFGLTGVPPAPSDPVDDNELFAPSEHRQFRHWQLLHRPSLVGFVASQSAVAAAAPAQREELLAEAGRLYDNYGRGPDGMLLPWHTHAFRSRISAFGASAATRSRRTGAGGTDGPDDDLLIDFK